MRSAALSIDSPFTTAAFARALELGFPVLSDWERQAVSAMGLLHDELFGYRPLPTRAALLIGSDGIVRAAWVSPDGTGLPPYDQLLEAAHAS